jgi:hypothetical protein
VSHHRAVLDVLRDAQTPAYRPHTSVKTLGSACSDRARGRQVPDGAKRSSRSNGYSVTVSAESHGLVNERVSHHRVVLGVLRDAQIPAYRPHTSVQTLGCARIRCTRRVRGGARSNGYSVMVLAESHGLVNERMSHHRVESDVLRDAQTSASRSHTSVHILWCVLASDEQRVTETSSE